MDPTLFVIVGAGASHDAASAGTKALEVRPPLVKGLFSDEHHGILSRYPLAQSAAPEIRDALRGGPNEAGISLERHLRERYRDSPDPYDKRRFYSITLYLQDLLWQASQPVVHFDNTDRLVASLLRRFHHTCFLTLNYDTILDQALAKLDPIDSINAYVNYGRWSLIKLHGSVDWGFAPLDDVNVDDPPADLPTHLSEEIHRVEDPPIVVAKMHDDAPRYISEGMFDSTKTFPALTVPVGEEDEVICPDSHQTYLDRRLAGQDELDILIVGYSAYDRTVIDRIGRTGKRIRSLTVVNADAEAGFTVVERLKRLLPQALNDTEISVASQSFGRWCRDSLVSFASSHPASTSAA